MDSMHMNSITPAWLTLHNAMSQCHNVAHLTDCNVDIYHIAEMQIMRQGQSYAIIFQSTQKAIKSSEGAIDWYRIGSNYSQTSF